MASCNSLPSASNINLENLRLKNFDYPFPVNFFVFKSQKQSLEMAYMDLNKSSKDVVVLLHGKNFSGFYWRDIAKDLVKKNYRVIIPDQIGFGKSSKPSYYQYNFAQLSLNTKKLLEHLNVNNFYLVGHSMGGMMAINMTDLYSNHIKQLILINPIGLEDYGKYVQAKDINFFYNLELNKNIDKIKSYQKKYYYDGKWNSSYEELIAPFTHQIGSPSWKTQAWNNALTYGPIFSENLLPKIQRLITPTTIILGTRDRTGPGRGWKKTNSNYKLGQYHLFKKRLLKLNPKLKIHELNDLGHMPQFEDYQRFSKLFFKIL